MWCPSNDAIGVGAIIALILIVVFFIALWIIFRKRRSAQGGWYSVGGRSLVANLSGSQVVPPLRTSASGSATAELYPNTKQLNYLIEVIDLPKDVVSSIELHSGQDGEVGPLIRTLYNRDLSECLGNKIVVDEKSNSWSLYDQWSIGGSRHQDISHTVTEQIINDLLTGNTYVIIYTDCEVAGILRGQLEIINSSAIYKF